MSVPVMPGRQADIIAMKGKPFRLDPSSVRDVEVVIQAGIVVKQPSPPES